MENGTLCALSARSGGAETGKNGRCLYRDRDIYYSTCDGKLVCWAKNPDIVNEEYYAGICLTVLFCLSNVQGHCFFKLMVFHGLNFNNKDADFLTSIVPF